MKQRIRNVIIGAYLFSPAAALAESAGQIVNRGACQPGLDLPGCGGAPGIFERGGLATQIAEILIFITGAVSVIMLIVGGLRYVLSGGNKDAVRGAKDTILYALVGVVIALAAYAIVAFLLSDRGLG